MDTPIEFALNGTPTRAACRADMTVLEWLRGEALLRGTKEGCAEGDCGACSVLVKRAGEKGEKYLPANSCIMLMGQLEGSSLVTVEGLAAMVDEGHPVQQKMAENGSSQCGFCTPGIVVALAGLLERNGIPEESEIHDALAGNLCRCTGYRPIVEAAQSAARSKETCGLPNGKKSSPKTQAGLSESVLFSPETLQETIDLKRKNPGCVLLAGGTDLSIDVAHARKRWPVIISTRNVTELRRIQKSRSEISFGGAVTWEEALPYLQKYWPSFATLVRRFGSTQIRSMGTIAGNLATASPIGDGAPALLALDASLTLSRKGKERVVPLDKFFLDYRKSALRPDEIISAVHVPLPSKHLAFRVYKISKRYDQDISTVCGAFALQLKGEKIDTCRMAFGGMAAIPKRCVDAEAVLAGDVLSIDAVEKAKLEIANTFSPMSDMRGSAEYRALVAGNLLQRFVLDLEGEQTEVMAQ